MRVMIRRVKILIYISVVLILFLQIIDIQAASWMHATTVTGRTNFYGTHTYDNAAQISVDQGIVNIDVAYSDSTSDTGSYEFLTYLPQSAPAYPSNLRADMIESQSSNWDITGKPILDQSFVIGTADGNPYYNLHIPSTTEDGVLTSDWFGFSPHDYTTGSINTSITTLSLEKDGEAFALDTGFFTLRGVADIREHVTLEASLDGVPVAGNWEYAYWERSHSNNDTYEDPVILSTSSSFIIDGMSTSHYSFDYAYIHLDVPFDEITITAINDGVLSGYAGSSFVFQMYGQSGSPTSSITGVPEPSMSFLVSLASLSILMRRRKKNKVL